MLHEAFPKYVKELLHRRSSHAGQFCDRVEAAAFGDHAKGAQYLEFQRDR